MAHVHKKYREYMKRNFFECTCSYCNVDFIKNHRTQGPTLDHIIPAKNNHYNFLWACGKCNTLLKKDKHIIDFIKYHRRRIKLDVTISRLNKITSRLQSEIEWELLSVKHKEQCQFDYLDKIITHKLFLDSLITDLKQLV